LIELVGGDFNAERQLLSSLVECKNLMQHFSDSYQSYFGVVRPGSASLREKGTDLLFVHSDQQCLSAHHNPYGSEPARQSRQAGSPLHHHCTAI
jgi:hypothetical protein